MKSFLMHVRTLSWFKFPEMSHFVVVQVSRNVDELTILGTMKMNVDGSSKEGMRSGIGGLIRNERGEWLKGFYGSIHPCYSLEAELQAMYTGLSILKSLEWRCVDVETDSLVVVNLLQETEDRTHPNHAMIEDCKSLIREMQTEVKHVMREDNKAADKLAKIGADQFEDLILLDEYPRALESALLSDMLHITDMISSMSREHCMPPQPEDFGGSHDGPLPAMHLEPVPLPPHPAALEEELELQHRHIQRILAENSHVFDENVILQRELSAVVDEIHRLGQIIPNLHGEKDARARELIDLGLMLEGELHGAKPVRAEVLQLRSEAQKLNSLRQELFAQVQTLTMDITRVQAENEELDALKTDIDVMRIDLVEMRRDYEIKKKANEEQLIQKEAIERNLVSMAWEIEKLRAERRFWD